MTVHIEVLCLLHSNVTLSIESTNQSKISIDQSILIMAAARASQVLTRAHPLTQPRILASVRLTGAKAPLPAVHRRAFSTPKNASGPGPTTETEVTEFSLKHLGVSRRTRFWLAAGLLTLGFIEGAAWVKFWPKITGRDKWEESAE